MKLTKWYSGYQKPVRQGVYQRAYYGGTMIRYCYWNGYIFGGGSIYKSEAHSLFFNLGASMQQKLPWRGIAK